MTALKICSWVQSNGSSEFTAITLSTCIHRDINRGRRVVVISNSSCCVDLPSFVWAAQEPQAKTVGHDGSEQSKGATLSGSKTAYSRWQVLWCNRKGLSEGWSCQTLRKVPEACVWKAEMLHFFCASAIFHILIISRLRLWKNTQTGFMQIRSFGQSCSNMKVCLTSFRNFFWSWFFFPNVDLFSCSFESNPASSRCSVLLYLDSKNRTKRLKNVTCVMFWTEMPTLMIWKVLCVKLLIFDANLSYTGLLN